MIFFLSHIQATYFDVIVIYGPTALYALSLTGWHFAMTFRKPIFVLEKKTKKQSVNSQ